jgi:glycosyltransferase involved in cell wall biosynthesis
MKLLILDQFSDPGGSQQGLLELLPAFRERGWEAIVGLPGAGRLFADVRQLGFPAEKIECGPYRSARKSVGDLVRFARGTPRLARHLALLADGVDVVYVNGPRVLPALALSHVAAPVIFHAHSYLGPGLLRTLSGRSLRRVQASVIANCEFVAAPWRNYVERVEIILNGVSGGALPATRLPGTAHVACIGRIAPEKGQLEFLKAAEIIHRSFPNARFTIYGATLFGEPGAEAYEREVRARAAGVPVEFAGWITDIYAALARIDVLLVPSAPPEATTRVILEAYAAGVPVVAFASGGIPEIVEDGVTGALTRSAAEMAEAALALLNNPARRAAMSAGARECWTRRFTLDRYRNDVLGALETARTRTADERRVG